jgi:hypothetical protein
MNDIWRPEKRLSELIHLLNAGLWYGKQRRLLADVWRGFVFCVLLFCFEPGLLLFFLL